MLRFQNSRLGVISAWLSFGAMAWIAVVASAHLVLRRFAVVGADFTDAALIFLAFVAVRSCRAIYVVLILPARARALARERDAA